MSEWLSYLGLHLIAVGGAVVLLERGSLEEPVGAGEGEGLAE